jgi:hypothetical protein
VPSAHTKNKRLAVQPLPPEVAEALRGYLEGRPAAQPVWPGSWADNAAEMLQAALEAAGIPYTVEGPDGPLHADFHALRHSYLWPQVPDFIGTPLFIGPSPGQLSGDAVGRRGPGRGSRPAQITPPRPPTPAAWTSCPASRPACRRGSTGR